MALTKADATFVSSQSCAAAATVTGSLVDLSAVYETDLQIKITNGATGPTVACSAVLETTTDGGTTWKERARWAAGVANNGVYQFNDTIPIGVQGARVVFTGNTGQAVTVEAFGSTVTALI